MPTKHAKYGPSGGKSREHCPHYRGYKGTSKASEDGTRAHEFVELYALTVANKKATRTKGRTKTNQGLGLTGKLKQMFDSFDNMDQQRLELICEHIRPLILKPGAKTEVEITLDVAGMTFGTADLAISYLSGNVVLGFDWKFGEWEVEHPRCNAQVWSYVVGLFHHYPDAKHVTFGIFQPKVSAEIMEHTFNRDQLPEMVDRVSKDQVRAKQADDHAAGMQNVSAHCTFCRRKIDCPAWAELVKDPDLKKLVMAKTLTIPKDLETSARRKNAGLLAAALIKYGTDLKDELARRWAEEDLEVDNFTLVRSNGKKTIKKADRVSAFEAGVMGLCDDEAMGEAVLEALQLSCGDRYETFVESFNFAVGSIPGPAMVKIESGGLVSIGDPSVYIRQKKL